MMASPGTRSLDGSATRFVGDPGNTLVRDRRRNLVAPLEFAERDVVASPSQRRHEDAAAMIDRKDLIGVAVRDEERRLAVRHAVDDEAGREGGDAADGAALDAAAREG